MESGFGQPYATISHSSPHTPRSYVQRQQNPSGLQSPWTDTASVVSSRPDSPGKCSQRFDAKSVSMCDTRSQGGSSGKTSSLDWIIFVKARKMLICMEFPRAV